MKHLRVFLLNCIISIISTFNKIVIKDGNAINIVEYNIYVYVKCNCQAHKKLKCVQKPMNTLKRILNKIKYKFMNTQCTAYIAQQTHTHIIIMCSYGNRSDDDSRNYDVFRMEMQRKR